MGKISKKKLLLLGSILSYLLMAVSILLMPIRNGNAPFFSRALMGAMFWGFLIAGSILQIVLSKMCKKKIKRKRDMRIGVLTCFATPYGKVADIVFLVSILGFVVTLFVTDGTMYISCVLLAVAVFSFCMHCIMNGKIVRSFHRTDEIQIDKL